MCGSIHLSLKHTERVPGTPVLLGTMLYELLVAAECHITQRGSVPLERGCHRGATSFLRQGDTVELWQLGVYFMQYMQTHDANDEL